MKKNILGVDITDAPQSEVLEYIFDFLKSSKEKAYIVTPNPEIIIYSLNHESYRKKLNEAAIALCDGVGVLWAAKQLGIPLTERITGVDFMENLCKESVRKGVSIGFLGGRNSVADRTAECLREKYPGIKIVFTGEEWPETAAKPQSSKASEQVNSATMKLWSSESPIDILFVAYGFPKQEEWIAEHLPTLPVRVMMGVGGAFDYLSGDISRAPKLMRDTGLEWVYRLIRQPWRLKRQLVLPRFFFLVVNEKRKRQKL